MRAAVWLIGFGLFWSWKAILSHFTTTGIGNQLFQGFPTPRASGRLSKAAGQRAAAGPCAVLGVSLLVPGLFLAGLSGPFKVSAYAVGAYLVIAQVVGVVWAMSRANAASTAAHAVNPNEPARY